MPLSFARCMLEDDVSLSPLSNSFHAEWVRHASDYITHLLAPSMLPESLQSKVSSPIETLADALTKSSYLGQSQNVQMFSEARDVSIRNSEITNVGGDLIINNYNVLLQPDSEPVQLSTWDHLSWQPLAVSNLKSKMFYAAESVRNLLPRPFSTTVLNMILEEKVAEDVLKYPPLPNATVLLSKTSLYIPGVMNQLLSSVRYSFFGN